MRLSTRPADAAEAAHAVAGGVALLAEALRELLGCLAVTGPWHLLAQAEDLAAHARDVLSPPPSASPLAAASPRRPSPPHVQGLLLLPGPVAH